MMLKTTDTPAVGQPLAPDQKYLEVEAPQHPLPSCVCAVRVLQSRVRLGRVWREGNVHHFVEWMVHTVCGWGRGEEVTRGCMRLLGVGATQQSIQCRGHWAPVGQPGWTSSQRLLLLLLSLQMLESDMEQAFLAGDNTGMVSK